MSILQDILAFLSSHFGTQKPRFQVEAELDAKAAGQNLDWRHSIVDLMKLTGQDSSLTARKQLARELGYTGELNGSAEMNIWLHSKVMERV